MCSAFWRSLLHSEDFLRYLKVNYFTVKVNGKPHFGPSQPGNLLTDFDKI